MREGTTHVTAMTAAGGESLLAHGIHYALVLGGVVGLGVLLLPQAFDRSRLLVPARPRSELDQRISLLRASVAEGTLLTGSPTRSLTLLAPQHRAARRAPVEAEGSTLALPVAAVGCLAAAGVHAAVGPAHFAEGVPIGLFFAVCALGQLGWVVLVARGPGPRLLAAGLVGNLAVVALWATTRTVGLPGLLPGPESVGAWDLASVGWELTSVAGCAAVLLSGRAAPSLAASSLAAWPRWHPAARAWLVGSVLVLAALSVSGASA
jgi:hypothetical protein